MEFDEERILSLKSDLVSYGKDITDHISALYTSKRSLSDSFDLKNDPANMLVMLKHELNQIVQVSQERADFAAQHGSEIAECTKLINLLLKLSSVTELLIACEKQINKFEFLKACASVDAMEIALNSCQSQSQELASGQVFTILKSECKLLSSKLNSKLKRSLNEAIRIEHGRVAVSRQLKGVLRAEDVVLDEPLQLSELWRAVVLTGKAEETVSEVLQRFGQFMLHPVWHEKKAQKPRVVAAEGDSGMSELVLDGLTRDLSSSDAKRKRIDGALV